MAVVRKKGREAFVQSWDARVQTSRWFRSSSVRYLLRAGFSRRARILPTPRIKWCGSPNPWIQCAAAGSR